MSTPTSGIPLWGQAWELAITYVTKGGGAEVVTVGSNRFQPEALRVTFEIQQSMNSAPLWYADISVYNLDDQTAQNLLVNATWVTLKAGFQFGPQLSSIIWDGPVFQPIYTRENVVDQKLTLHCIALPGALSDTISFSMGQFSSQLQLIQRMIAENNAGANPSPLVVKLGQVARQRMLATQYPRGNTVFGKVSKFLTQVSDSNQVQAWNDGQQAYISEVASGVITPSLIYSPAFPPGGVENSNGLPPSVNQSIVGTPQQIQQGVIFTVLLDPRLKVNLPPQLVQLVRTNITQLAYEPSVNSKLPTLLATADSSNLTFYVSQVRHTGDTRGNDWQTEVIGFSTIYAQTLLNMFTG